MSGVIDRATGEWLSKKQVAAYVRVSLKTVQRWIAGGILPASRQGKVLRIRKADIDTFMGVLARGGAGPGPSRRPPNTEMSVEDMARELAADVDLQVAYRNLKTALADSRMRESALTVLEALARAAHPRA